LETVRPTRVLVVANRTAATPWLLQEIEQRSQDGRCEFALLVPPTGGRHPDWTLDVALAQVEQAAAQRVETVHCDRDWVSSVQDALRERPYDEVLIATRPPSGPRWLHHHTMQWMVELGVPVTTMIVGERMRLDHGVLKVRWDDDGVA
jgi:hypothetical protein